MQHLTLICSLSAAMLASACGSSSVSAPTANVLRYSGTVSQPAPGGFLVYKLAGAWTLNPDGSLLSGADTVTIVDATVYGVQGTTVMTLKTRCVGIKGKDAWAENEVVTTSNPGFAAVGSRSIVRLSLASGKPQGGGGPLELWYPTGNVCVDRPAAMPAFDMPDGHLAFP